MFWKRWSAKLKQKISVKIEFFTLVLEKTGQLFTAEFLLSMQQVSDETYSLSDHRLGMDRQTMFTWRRDVSVSAKAQFMHPCVATA